MVKSGVFRQIFSLACTSSGGVIYGRDKCGNVYQDCGLCYSIKKQKEINTCQTIKDCSGFIILVEEYLMKNEVSSTDHEYIANFTKTLEKYFSGPGNQLKEIVCTEF